MAFLLGVSIYQHILLNLSVCEECLRTFAMGLWHAWSFFFLMLFEIIWNYLELFQMRRVEDKYLLIEFVMAIMCIDALKAGCVSAIICDEWWN